MLPCSRMPPTVSKKAKVEGKPTSSLYVEGLFFLIWQYTIQEDASQNSYSVEKIEQK